MKIQQHDSVVVDAAEFCRASPSDYRRRRCSKGRGRRQDFRVRLPSLPLLYIGPQGAPALEMRSPKGGSGQGVECPPRQVEAPPTLGFPP